MTEDRKRTRPGARPGEKTYWLDNSRNVDKLVWSLYGLCVLLLVVDPLVPKHGPFIIEHWFGFYGIYGFVACIGLVLAAKELRKLVMRPEDYYDE